MRRVKFIRSLVVDEVTAFDEVEYHRAPPQCTMTSDGALLTGADHVTHRVIPVTHLCQNYRDRVARTDTYIAYSDEVCELLETPINTIIESNNRLQSDALELRYELGRFKRWRSAHTKSFWKRLMFVFKPSMQLGQYE